jgi:hypothetical protein
MFPVSICSGIDPAVFYKVSHTGILGLRRSIYLSLCLYIVILESMKLLYTPVANAGSVPVIVVAGPVVPIQTYTDACRPEQSV